MAARRPAKRSKRASKSRPVSGKKETPRRKAQKPARRATARKTVSKATREKLARQRAAYLRTGLKKAERELLRLQRATERQAEKVRALRREAESRAAKAERARDYQRTIRARMAQERISYRDAVAAEKASRELVRAGQRFPRGGRARPEHAWAPEFGTEAFAFELARTDPEVPGMFPPGTDVTAVLHLMQFGGPPSHRDITDDQTRAVRFNTGATVDEFWSNFYAAIREARREYLADQGLPEKPENSQDDVSYTVASIAAA